MSMFDGLVVVDKNGNILQNNWIEWDHYSIPNKPKNTRDILRNLMALFGHCLVCTSIAGCYFVERKMPTQPQHENCDCSKKQISFSIVKTNVGADCPIEKFTKYIFTNDKDSKGKKSLFESWGYTIKDSAKLSKIYQEQAIEQYINGFYDLNILDKFGQRLSITITLNEVSFKTGWMLEPEGKIRCRTPFGGWIQ